MQGNYCLEWQLDFVCLKFCYSEVPLYYGSIQHNIVHSTILVQVEHSRNHSVYAPSQWETTLQCNVVSHWLNACTEWSLHRVDSEHKHIPKLTLRVQLTHWGQVTHICISKLTIIGSDNGLSPGWHQAIIWTSAWILLIGPLETTSVKF